MNETLLAYEYVGNFTVWLNATVEAQAALTLFETPVMTRAVIDAKLAPVKAYIGMLAKRPRPIPKVVPIKVNATNSTKASNSTNSTKPTATNETVPEAEEYAAAEAEGDDEESAEDVAAADAEL